MTEKLGRYEILEEIGQGSFAIVYRARDTELDRLVALKELRSLLLTDTSWVKRFRQEARAIARLDHPRIVTIHDVGQAAERQFIVMRLANGPGLDELIATRGRLPWPEAVEIITAVAEGLDYAHTHGILHRDLKPANILMDPERGPLLSDFGFAKLVGESSTSMSGSIVGTPHYIAPEAWEGQTVTPQADIYALGCILHEMLTGEKTFPGETPPMVMMAHFKSLELPKTWPESVPSGVAEVLATALARQPADRYATAGEMAGKLAGLAADERVEPDQPPAAVTEAKSEHAATWQQTAEQALAEGNLEEAEQAAQQWQELTPDAPDLAAFWQKLQGRARLPEKPLEHETPPPSPATAPPSAPRPPAPSPAAVPATPHSPPSFPMAPPFAPWAARAGWRRRRPGCLLVGAIVAMGLMMLMFGVGTFCSAIRGTVDSMVGPMSNNMFPDVEIGATHTEKIYIPLPDSSDPVSLEIDTDAGKLILTPGAAEALLEGTATYNVAQLKPAVTIDGTDFRLEHESGVGFSGFFRSDIKNTWDLKLGSAPMELTINAGSAESDIELGGLSLANLKISQGASEFDLSFSEPNRTEMDTLKFEAIASDATLTGLANVNARDITFQGGAGDYTLDFGGELRNDVDVSIHSGFGSIMIIVPEPMPAQVSVDGEEINVSARGAWQKSGDGYALPGAGTADHQITIVVQMGAGRLELRNP